MSRESESKARPPDVRSSDQTVAAAPVLARWLRISGKAYHLSRAGVLVHVSLDHFLVEESVRRYCEHIRRTTLRSVGAALGSKPAANAVNNSTANSTATH